MKLVRLPVLAIGLIGTVLALAGCNHVLEGTYQGWVEADLVFVGPDETGRIEMLSVREGEAVTQGAPLFTVDADLQQADVAQNEATLANARQAFERAQQLVKTGAGTQKAFDDAHAAQPILIAGTMSNLNIRLDQTEAVAATSYVFTVRKDATTATMADTTLTCTVSGATGTSCSDTRHSVVCLSTDLVDLKMAPTGTPTDHINVSWLVKFVPS